MSELKNVVSLGHSITELQADRLGQTARGDYRGRGAAEVQGNGNAVDSIEAVPWCFVHTDI